ncbi:uncharacterized protein LY89DRAFT_686844 [Mollisia scopiformis]|uniref:Uncharacterized protein n=1 Tax=Mollisia scopiformis TaxID=149040 RepID=A0A194X2W2_MOLSC|nr:uncharacterized protein LY89DRAFT_686844 [Mollisia scopiformis]KUJ14364.1 hypothetical protein LY89DRAFT_686844 [Mollisia scopiformis]
MAQDPHQGGDLFDMAKDGTTIPNDAGKMRTIPSVPRPGEGEGDVNANRSSLASAASNPTDISRGVRDMGATGEVETGTGDQLPGAVESKRLHYGANEPLSKGHDRYDKHSRQKESDLERYAEPGPGVDLQPSEDGIARNENLPDEEVDRIVDSRERKQT